MTVFQPDRPFRPAVGHGRQGSRQSSCRSPTEGGSSRATSRCCDGSYAYNRKCAVLAEEAGLDFVMSMSKFRGYGGETQHWNSSLDPIVLMAALAEVTKRVKVWTTLHTILHNPALRGQDDGDPAAGERRPRRAQHRHRLVQGRVLADGRLARRRRPRPALRPGERVDPRHQGGCGPRTRSP